MKKRIGIIIIVVALICCMTLLFSGCSAILSGLGGIGSSDSDDSPDKTGNSTDRPDDDIGSACLKYTLNADGTGYIVDGVFSSQNQTDEIIISPTYNGLPVIELATECFKNWDIVSCSMPDTIKKIGKDAFYKCDEMTSVKIPRDCEIIDEYAFYSCKINSISWGDSLVSIGEKAFAGAFNCSYVILPDGITKIGKSAFSSNNIMFFIPDSVERIGADAFYTMDFASDTKTIYCESTSAGINWDESWNSCWAGGTRKTMYGASEDAII